MDEELLQLASAEDLDAEIARIQKEMGMLKRSSGAGGAKKRRKTRDGSTKRSSGTRKSRPRKNSTDQEASVQNLLLLDADLENLPEAVKQLSEEDLEQQIQLLQSELQFTESLELLGEKELKREIERTNRELAKLEKMTQQAAAGGRRSTAPENAQQNGSHLYCICRRAYTPEDPMISCDICDEWFHLECLGMVPEEAELLNFWICHNCTDADAEVTAAILEETVEAKLQVVDDETLEEDLAEVEAELAALKKARQRAAVKSTTSSSGSRKRKAGRGSSRTKTGSRPSKRHRTNSSSGSRRELPEILRSGPQSTLASPAPEFDEETTIGDRLRWVMKAFSMRKEELTEEAGITPTQLTAWLSGREVRRAEKQRDELDLWLLSMEERYLEQQIALEKLAQAEEALGEEEEGGEETDSDATEDEDLMEEGPPPKSVAGMRKGDKILVKNERDAWRKGAVLALRRGAVKVQFIGRSSSLAEWIPVSSNRVAPLGSVDPVPRRSQKPKKKKQQKQKKTTPKRASKSARTATEDTEPEEVIANDDSCFVCKLGGNLICCDGCPKVYHANCRDPPVDMHSLPERWYCSRHCKSKKKF